MNMDLTIFAVSILIPVLFGFGILIPMAMDTAPEPESVTPRHGFES